MTLRHTSINGSRGLFERKDRSIIYRQEHSESAFSIQVSISSSIWLPRRNMDGTGMGDLA